MFFSTHSKINWTEIFNFVIRCLIFYEQYNFVSVKALVGENVALAQHGQFSFIVSIMRISRRNPNAIKNHVCTGSLITPQDVLTAEHCTTNVQIERIQIVVGSIDLLRGTKYVPMWWLTYAQWASQRNLSLEFGSNDVATIKLTGNVPANIQPVQVATSINNSLYGKNVQLAGWGKASNGEISQILQTVFVKVLKNSECTARILALTGETHRLHKRRLCTAATPYALVDSGDSGGPVIYHNKIIGINRGVIPSLNGTLHPQQLNFHFSVVYYKDFIQDIINNYQVNFN